MYNLNVTFSISISGRWQSIAALELGKYQNYEQAIAERDSSDAYPPAIVHSMRELLEAHYEQSVDLTFSLSAPPRGKVGLSI